MSTNISSKINLLLKAQPLGTVLLSSWLLKKGYSRELQKRYKKSRWFESIGSGALIRSGDDVDYLGGLYALQTQLSLSTHVAARSALTLLDRSYFIDSSNQSVLLLSAKNVTLPIWYRKYDWQIKLEHKTTDFLPKHLALTDFSHKGFNIRIATPERAILECLYLSSDKKAILEAYRLLERLSYLRFNLLQELLENCSSIKVKRLFLFMAEKAKHKWFQYLNLSRIELGSGKRSLVKEGVYIAKYKITLPQELV